MKRSIITALIAVLVVATTAYALEQLGTAKRPYETVHTKAITTNNVKLTLPTADGTAGQALVTNGSGTLSFSAAVGGTAWDDISNPDDDQTITWADNYTTILSFADTNEDMLTIKGVGAFGDVSVMRVEQSTGAATDGTVLEVVSGDANVDPLVVSANGVANALVVGQTGAVTTASDFTVGGNLAVTGTTTLTGSMYQAAIASAAAGNVALTVNAAGNGTITVGGVSTGNTIFPGVVVANGNVDIGNAATDTLTITSIVDSNVTLDDGATDSPSMILKDATDETATFTKVDGADVTVTPGGATEAVRVVTGNLRVGNGVPGVAAMNGEDTYLEGELEVDGAVQLDGAITATGGATISGTTATATTTVSTLLDVNEEIDVDWDANDEEMNITTTAADYAAGSGLLTIFGSVAAGETNATWPLRIAWNANGDAQDGYILCQDNSSGAAGNGDTKFQVGTGGTTVWTLDAASYAQIDAATTSSTTTAGVLDMNVTTVTNGNEGVNMLYTVGDTGAGVTATGIMVDTVDNTAANAATINAISAVSSDIAGHATTVNTGFFTSGMDVAFQANNGYVRIGTGSTPDVTPGDDDLYVEGTAEIDGAVRIDSTLTAQVPVVDCGAGTPYAVTAAQSGTVFTTSQACEFDLPAAAANLEYSFVVNNASNLHVDPDAADAILYAGCAAGDRLLSATVGDTVTLVGIAAGYWAVKSIVPGDGSFADTIFTDAN